MTRLVWFWKNRRCIGCAVYSLTTVYRAPSNCQILCSENASKLLSLTPFDLKQPATIMERDGVVAEDHPGERENVEEEKGSRKQRAGGRAQTQGFSESGLETGSLVSITP